MTNNDLIKKYKPLELDYNVQSAVENLKMAYWNNDSEKYAKIFTEAEEIIVNAICHFDYIVCKRPQGEWIKEGTEIGAFGIKYTWNKCSKCGWSSSLVLPKNFCPNCGADMRGGEKND